MSVFFNKLEGIGIWGVWDCDRQRFSCFVNDFLKFLAISNTVLQLKVTLKGIRPPIWRTILIPSNYTFYRLHLAIQSAMGWKNKHSHAFKVRMSSIARNKIIGQFFKKPKDKVIYEYDFGDYWVLEVLLQKLLPADPTTKKAICIRGKRAGPPEDCGGAEGYQELLESLRDATHSQHNEMKQWLRQINKEDFDPELFISPGCL